jgi:hypothetical protein
LCQIYVDDVIFGGTSQMNNLAIFELMTWKLEMSVMGELTFFLGFQVKQLCE